MVNLKKTWQMAKDMIMLVAKDAGNFARTSAPFP
jgi:hypothetical protein